MERKEFVNLCRLASAATGNDAVPHVNYGGKEYYPFGYQLTFDANGAAIHTAIIVTDKSVHYARLAEIEAVL